MEKSRKSILQKNLKPYIKMDKKIISFDDTKIEEHKFQKNKSPVSISNIDINETVVSDNLPFGEQDFKYFMLQRFWKK